MSKLALYRKYRSRNFDSVLGQPHITATLKTAIASGHISHAYLFTGPRGVGKTTVARLLARSLNCLGDSKPCNNCRLCQVELSSSLDLIEIDAASNRRIDEIRELRDKISLAPASGRYKVYIIDEVHMLTTEAFNALLKTLEEPPAHAVFILATTEAHKLPETIISRTQRFNFRALDPTVVSKGLADIAQKEKLQITPEALDQLGIASRGSLRDGISMLDQVASAGTKGIDLELVRRILGWSQSQTIDQLSLAIIEQNPSAALRLLDQDLAAGSSVSQIMTQLIERWRLVLLAVAGPSQSQSGSLESAASHMTTDKIITILDALMTAQQSPWQQLALETALVRLTFVAGTDSKTIRPATEPLPAESTAHDNPTPPQTETSDTDVWTTTLAQIKLQNNSLYALLRSCQNRLTADQMVLVCRFSFHRDRLEENRSVIASALEQALGHPIRLTIQLDAKADTKQTSDPASELVSSALEILGGEVVDGS